MKKGTNKGIVLSWYVILCICIFTSKITDLRLQKDIVAKFEDKLKADYISDSMAIAQWLASSTPPSEWAFQKKTDFAIKVNHGDSLIYWHGLQDVSRFERNWQSPYWWRNSFHLGDYECHFELLLFNPITRKSIAEPSIHFDQNSSKILKLLDQQYPVSIASHRYATAFNHLYFILLIMLFTIILNMIWSRPQKNKNYSNRLILLLAIVSSVVLLILFSIVWEKYFFTDSARFYLESFGPLNINFINFCLGIIIVLFSIRSISLPSSKKIETTPIRQFFAFSAGFTISLAFLLKSWLIERYIQSGIVEYDTKLILNLNTFSILFVLFLVLLSFSIFYLSVQFFVKLASNRKLKHKYIYLIGGVIVAMVSSFMMNLDINRILLFIFLCSYILLIDVFVETEKKNITFLFWWLLIFSGFYSVLIYSNTKKFEIQSIESRAKDALIPLSEIEKEHFSALRDLLVESGFFLSLSQLEAGNEQLKNLLIQTEGLIFNYDSPIDYKAVTAGFIFENRPFIEEAFIHDYYIDWKKLLNESEKVSDHIWYNPISRNVILDFYVDNPRDMDSPMVYRILFQDIRFDKELWNGLEPFMIFKDGSLLRTPLMDIPDNIVNPALLTKSELISGIQYLFASPLENYQFVHIRKEEGLIRPISVFSFVFALMGLLSLLIAFLNNRFSFLSSEMGMNIIEPGSLQSRIQTTIVILLVFSLVLIGLITAIFFRNSVRQLETGINQNHFTQFFQYLQTRLENDELKSDALFSIQEGLIPNLKTKESNIRILNIYGLPLHYDFEYPRKQLIDHNTIAKLQRNNNENKKGIQIIDQHKKNIVYPVYHKNEMIAMATLPLGNQSKFKYLILEYLSTLLNVYIFLFILAVSISIAISNSIVRPLSELTSRIRQFKLGGQNPKLEWNSNDEVGVLIKHFNEMSHKLSESANIIARTERDTAWREMAKQVAHEIKNPLTPMKLSIQYLQRAIESDPENAKPLIKKISATLIEQINNLSQIAGEFSNFATLPKASNEKIILNEVVEHIHDLFRKRDDMDIMMTEPIEDIYVYADRNHLVRILNNIVKNATQAIPEGKRGKIELKLLKSEKFAIVRISDNGIGISEDMREKVFTPNFTTKSSGTGLGLAISANMIDSMNGRIYFESIPGEGSKFFIELPLVRKDDFEGEEIVLLED
jgi:two-component system, NtrC family, nitrogen regulation sensor histidine kinase NtrY